MEKIKHEVQFQRGTVNELDKRLKGLVRKARSASENAYAPYSNFKVGAAIELENGELILGSNQENASYPAGLCAERVAIFYTHSSYPNSLIKTLAIYAPVTDEHIIPSPCGNCRQVIAEFRNVQNAPIQILLINSNDQYWIFNDILDLLPYDFNSLHLAP